MLQWLSIYNYTRTSLSSWQRIIEKLRSPFFQFILNICMFTGKKKNGKKSHYLLAIQTHTGTDSLIQYLYENYIWNTRVLGSQLKLLSHRHAVHVAEWEIVISWLSAIHWLASPDSMRMKKDDFLSVQSRRKIFTTRVQRRPWSVIIASALG